MTNDMCWIDRIFTCRTFQEPSLCARTIPTQDSLTGNAGLQKKKMVFETKMHLIDFTFHA